jgi:hypothetical protein
MRMTVSDDAPQGTAEISSQWLFLLPRPTAAHSPEGRKIQKLLELPPIPCFPFAMAAEGPL